LLAECEKRRAKEPQGAVVASTFCLSGCGSLQIPHACGIWKNPASAPGAGITWYLKTRLEPGAGAEKKVAAFFFVRRRHAYQLRTAAFFVPTALSCALTLPVAVAGHPRRRLFILAAVTSW
jgi:hypothetical protein